MSPSVDTSPRLLTPGRVLVAVVAVLTLFFGGRAYLARGEVPAADTVTITRGEYADIVEIRGQVQPVRSIYVTAPYNAGELQILKIAPNGTAVHSGDVVAEFDAVTLRRTIQEKQSELRSATAELQQGLAQSRITVEERQAAVKRGEFDVAKARLSIGEIGLVSEIEAGHARLALADAEQRLHEGEASATSARANAETDRRTRERRIEKLKQDLALAEQQVAALNVKAPTDGTVNILPNYRATSPTGIPQEYRAGDRAYPGAVVLELPDLSAVYLTARIDEPDRGRLVSQQPAVIRVDAIADRDYQATVSEISVLARTDFTSGWPPTKQFDLKLTLKDPDQRLRPGMSALARIAVGRLPDVLLAPAASVFYENGKTVVYRLNRGRFDGTPVEVLRRGREQVALSGAIAAGDRIARRRPDTAPQEGSR
ncbi:MAG: efflux RND transporter periplasmic adaptor subunit [Vicinamibacterales bacterium]